VRYLGKLIGAVLGWVLLRHPLGALLGALLGHGFDAGWLAWRRPPPPAAAPPPPAPPGEDPHTVLGVAADASDAEIDRAYRQLMGRFHPDRVAGAAAEVRAQAEVRAREINGAYDRIRERRRARR
jgi:DnaJ-domain-containing protein 1